MSRTVSSVNAAALFEAAETALAVTDLPSFRSADVPGQIEVLTFAPPAEAGEEPTWALVPQDRPDDEFVAIDAGMAQQLLCAHFRDWLLQRGFQVQVHCYANLRRWTLADCLSVADGGGDRLDVDYPYGDEELAVLVDSIIAVNTI